MTRAWPRWRRSAWAAATVAGVAAALTLTLGLGDTPLVDWDESIYADVARGVHGGDILALHWNGEPYWRKPPLLFWAMAASYGSLGVHEAAARLPSALAGVATVATVAGILGARVGMGAALASTAMLLGSPIFIERGGRHACTDSFAILFTVLALASAGSGGSRRRGVAAGVFAGLAVLSKGAAGLVAPMTLTLLGLFDAKRRSQVRLVWSTAALVAGPWYAAQLASGGMAFVHSHFGHELVARAVRPIHGHGAPWFYPIEQLWVVGGVWAPIVVLASVWIAIVDPKRRADLLPWLAGAAVVVLSAVAMQTKLPWYSLPALPLLAVAGGHALAAGSARFARVVRPAQAAVVLAAIYSGSIVPSARESVLAQERPFEEFRTFGIDLARISADESLVASSCEHPTLIFYSGRSIRIYDAEDLSRLLRDPTVPPYVGLVPEDRAVEVLDAGGEEIGRLGDLVLLRLSPS